MVTNMHHCPLLLVLGCLCTGILEPRRLDNLETIIKPCEVRFKCVNYECDSLERLRVQQWTSLHIHCYTLGPSVSRTDPQMWGCWIKGRSRFPPNFTYRQVMFQKQCTDSPSTPLLRFPFWVLCVLIFLVFCQAEGNKSIIILCSFSIRLLFHLRWNSLWITKLHSLSDFLLSCHLFLTVYESSLHTGYLIFYLVD